MCTTLLTLLKIARTSKSLQSAVVLQNFLESQLGLIRHTRHTGKQFHTSTTMAHSKWTYVKSFELDDALLPNCWIVARLDGKGFHKLARIHKWKRPNDTRAINLMNHAAKSVLREYCPIIMAYGQSDEYSFVFKKDTKLFERRSSKLITTLVSTFTSSFVLNWNTYFPDEVLKYPPAFDGRLVLYPTDQNLRDYLCWRQADCHINNLYNTVFWALVQQGGMTNSDAEKRLCGTLSGEKNEILFSQFEINYNNEPELFRKGTVLVKREPTKPKLSRKQFQEEQARLQAERLANGLSPESEEDNFRSSAIELNCDIIRDDFWNEYPYLLSEPSSVTSETGASQEKPENRKKESASPSS